MTGKRLRSLRVWHRLSALVLGVFLVAHLLNHLAGLFGQSDHIAVMKALRRVYRHPLVEPCLLALFAAQIVTGLTMVAKGWRDRTGKVAWLQALSGLYLALFLAIHITSVLAGRIALGLDTDFRFAAAGFHVPGWPYYFWPYYFCAIASLFAHIGCASYWMLIDARRPGRAVAALVLSIMSGLLFALLVNLALAGQLHPVDIPARYLTAFGK